MSLQIGSSEEKLFTSRRHVPPHHPSNGNITEFPSSGPHFVLDKTGDGSSKFSAGFWRKIGEPSKPVREADQAAREQHHIQHESMRLENLKRVNDRRNGFNPITGEQYAAPEATDNYRPRGPRTISSEPNSFTKLEATKRMRDTSLRFFRVEDPSDPRIAARAIKINESGLSNFTERRRTADIGFGRGDLLSKGAADAFAASNYGGDILASDEVRAMCTTRPPSVAEARTVWNLALDAPDLERRRQAVVRAPNRVFDFHSQPVVLVAQPDHEARAIRETRDLQRSRPARPADRPLDFSATASMLATQRVRTMQSAEVDMVRSLRL
jgi:hypothetical protein